MLIHVLLTATGNHLPAVLLRFGFALAMVGISSYNLFNFKPFKVKQSGWKLYLWSALMGISIACLIYTLA